MDPGDPSQALTELFESAAAVYTKACRQTATFLKRDISAIDVHEHMLACAKEDANEFILLLELKLLAVISMMVDAEKTGAKGCNPDLFRHAMKLACIFFCVTNSFKYVQIVSEFGVWWECASEADKLIWQHFVFTAAIGDGKRIFLNRFMEWMVRDIRDVLGKFQSRNMFARLIKTIATFQTRKKVKNEMKAAQNTSKDKLDPTTSAIDVGYVFMHTYSIIENMKTWDRGNDRYYCCGKKKKDPNNTHLYDISGKILLNPDIISLISIGMSRWEEYAKKYYLEGELHTVVRPYRDTNLAKIPIHMGEKIAVEKRNNQWNTSLNVDELADFRKDDLIENLTYLNGQLQANGMEELANIPKSYNRKIHAAAVVDARKKLNSIMNDNDYDTPGAWKDKVSESTTVEGRIKDALEHSFFNVSQEAKNTFGDHLNKVYKVNMMRERSSLSNANGETSDNESNSSNMSIFDDSQ